MFNLIIIIIVISLIYKKFAEKSTVTLNKLNALFKAQNFHDITKDMSIPGLLLITASSHGENYLFAQKNNMAQFSIMDINLIYERAQKAHIHNIVIFPLAYSSFSNAMLEKMNQYDIQIWDNNKINSLIYSPSSTSVLSTSDTSDDKCQINPSNFEPIQKPTSFWKNFFNKPDRL